MSTIDVHCSAVYWVATQAWHAAQTVSWDDEHGVKTNSSSPQEEHCLHSLSRRSEHGAAAYSSASQLEHGAQVREDVVVQGAVSYSLVAQSVQFEHMEPADEAGVTGMHIAVEDGVSEVR